MRKIKAIQLGEGQITGLSQGNLRREWECKWLSIRIDPYFSHKGQDPFPIEEMKKLNEADFQKAVDLGEVQFEIALIKKTFEGREYFDGRHWESEGDEVKRGVRAADLAFYIRYFGFGECDDVLIQRHLS